MAKLLSINVGTPDALGSHRGKKIMSGIRKRPVSGSVIVRKLNLDGDKQADLTVHGGLDKAVYVYPSENYPYWRKKFPEMEMPRGTFGENLTTEGILESTIHIGDKLTIGSAQFEVSQPRFPCFKLGMRFGTSTMIKLFLESLRSGFYLRVIKEGKIRAGEEITVESSDATSETIESIVRTFIENEKANS